MICLPDVTGFACADGYRSLEAGEGMLCFNKRDTRRLVWACKNRAAIVINPCVVMRGGLEAVCGDGHAEFISDSGWACMEPSEFERFVKGCYEPTP